MPRGPITTRPCPVCRAECEVKRTKKGKPYWQCETCGVQVFVRGQEGIQRFEGSRGGPQRAESEDFWT